MPQYKLTIKFLDNDINNSMIMYDERQSISRSLHWFRKGAPPGIAGSACTA